MEFKKYALGSNSDSLIERTVAYPVQSALGSREHIATYIGNPCQLSPEVRRHGHGIVWAGGDPCMIGRLEHPLA